MIDSEVANQYYHNTKALFEKYRDMRWSVTKATTDAVRTMQDLIDGIGIEREYANAYAKMPDISDDSEHAGMGDELKKKAALVAGELLEDHQIIMSAGRNRAASHVNGLLKSVARIKEFLDAIDMAANFMRKYHKKGEEYYWILYYAYFSPQQAGVAEIIDMLPRNSKRKQQKISVTTYNRYLKEATELMSSIMWGYDLEEYEDILKVNPPCEKKASKDQVNS